MSQIEVTKKQRKPLPKPLLAAMCVAMLAMIVFLVWSFLPSSPPSTPAHEQEIFDVPENIVPVTPPIKVEKSNDAHLAMTASTPSEPLISEAPVQKEKEVTPFKLSLSEPAQTALDNLESRYYSEIRTQLIAAQIKEKKETRTLNSYNPPPKKPVVVPKKVVKNPARIVEHLSLKSVVFNPNQTSAWFEFEGALIPVKQGAWIDEVKVYRINKEHVILIDKYGKTYRKYMPKRKVVIDEPDSQSKRPRQ